MIVEVSMPFGSLMNHYIGVVDYGLGSAPRLAYRDSEKRPQNFPFFNYPKNTKVGSYAKILGQHYEYKKDPWW
jgi:hypothetical protein